MEIGERIRWLRKQRNMTIETLGRKVGVTRQTISRYETGAIEEIPMEKLETISSCFDVDISYLMGLSIDSQIDSLNFDIQKARSALDNVSDQESREELEQEIFVLNESLDDLCLAKNLSDSASTTKGLRSKSDNVYTPFTVGRHVKEWHSDKKELSLCESTRGCFGH